MRVSPCHQTKVFAVANSSPLLLGGHFRIGLVLVGCAVALGCTMAASRARSPDREDSFNVSPQGLAECAYSRLEEDEGATFGYGLQPRIIGSPTLNRYTIEIDNVLLLGYRRHVVIIDFTPDGPRTRVRVWGHKVIPGLTPYESKVWPFIEGCVPTP